MYVFYVSRQTIWHIIVVYTATTSNHSELIKKVVFLPALSMPTLHPKRLVCSKLRCYIKTREFHILVYTIFDIGLPCWPVPFCQNNILCNCMYEITLFDK